MRDCGGLKWPHLLCSTLQLLGRRVQWFTLSSAGAQIVRYVFAMVLSDVARKFFLPEPT